MADKQYSAWRCLLQFIAILSFLTPTFGQGTPNYQADTHVDFVSNYGACTVSASQPCWGQVANTPANITSFAVNRSGDMWIISQQYGCDANGCGIAHFNKSTGNWDQVPGSATKIVDAPDGTAFVMNAQGQMYQWNGSQWFQPWFQWSYATDISVSQADGTFAIIGTDASDCGNQVYVWDGSNFNGQGWGGNHISIIDSNSIWVTCDDHSFDPNGNIRHWDGQQVTTVGGWLDRVNPLDDDKVWGVASGSFWYHDFSQGTGWWTQMQGTGPQIIAADEFHTFGIGTNGNLYQFAAYSLVVSHAVTGNYICNMPNCPGPTSLQHVATSNLQIQGHALVTAQQSANYQNNFNTIASDQMTPLESLGCTVDPSYFIWQAPCPSIALSGIVICPSMGTVYSTPNPPAECPHAVGGYCPANVEVEKAQTNFIRNGAPFNCHPGGRFQICTVPVKEYCLLNGTSPYTPDFKASHLYPPDVLTAQPIFDFSGLNTSEWIGFAICARLTKDGVKGPWDCVHEQKKDKVKAIGGGIQPPSDNCTNKDLGLGYIP